MPYNQLNLPALDQAAHRNQANAFNMERAKVGAERADAAYDEEQQLQNARFLYGATEVMRKFYEAGDMDQYNAAAVELGDEGMRRGLPLDGWDPKNVPIEEVMKVNAAAKTRLAGRPANSEMQSAGNQTADIQNYEYVAALTPEQRQLYFQVKRNLPGANLKEITRSDGSKQMVIWDEQSKRAYDLSGQPLSEPLPGMQGDGSGGAVPNAQVQDTQSGGPELGVSPTPAQEAADIERAKMLVKAQINDEQSFSADVLANQMQIDQVQGTIDDIDRAIGITNWWSVGVPGQIMEGIGATDARSLRAKLEPIKASLAFDRLQQMRDASKTGGALGQVSERELALLMGSLESLDQAQDVPSMIGALKRVRSHYQNVLRVQKAQQALRQGAPFIATPDEAMKLSPGTMFVNPNGDILRVPGA